MNLNLPSRLRGAVITAAMATGHYPPHFPNLTAGLPVPIEGGTDCELWAAMLEAAIPFAAPGEPVELRALAALLRADRWGPSAGPAIN